MVTFELLPNVVEPGPGSSTTLMTPMGNSTNDGYDSTVSLLNLSFLTFQAVFETVIVCSFGYLAARSKILTPSVQRHISTLNVQLFTPCLVFSKLVSSLSLSALADIAVIPVLFVITTGISMLCARFVSRICRFNKVESNFVTAMAVFGNSNSLPVSLTVSLAYTLPNLLWPDLANDNQDDVASRGILYLLIFQQLGQILRWSWGYNTLLAKPAEEVTLEAEWSDDEERQANISTDEESDDEHDYMRKIRSNERTKLTIRAHSPDQQSTYSNSSSSSSTRALNRGHSASTLVSRGDSDEQDMDEPKTRCEKLVFYSKKWGETVLEFMNPPLWAMLIAIIVASVPPLKHGFFENGGFVQNTLTKAISQLGSIAIPMILLVLGSNLAPNDSCAPASARYGKIVTASLLCRMILPSLILLPIIALSVKYINISILDDPIFLLVAFILTVSPPAIQLSQICQLNEIFEKEMAGVLFWGYVVLTLPTTIGIVVSSLEVLEWAGTTKS